MKPKLDKSLSAGLSVGASKELASNRQLDVSKIFDYVKKEFAQANVPGNVTQEILQEAGEMIAASSRGFAPMADKIVKLYGSQKISKRYKAPKGMGKVKKRIKPGTLKKSIEVLKHGRFKTIYSAVFVGVRIKKAYFAHFVHFGTKNLKNNTPFMKLGFNAAKGTVTQFLYKRYRSAARKSIREAIQKHG